MSTKPKTKKPPEGNIERKWRDHFDGIQARLFTAMHDASDALADYFEAANEFKTSLSGDELGGQAKRLELVEEKAYEMQHWVDDANENVLLDLNDLVYFNWSDEELD